MGRKSREKRERRRARQQTDPSFMLRELIGSQAKAKNAPHGWDSFNKRLEDTRALFRQYDRLDAAIALGVSEVWPANAGSPVKHIFAWCVLLDLPLEKEEDIKSISNYEEFKEFAKSLYEAWPDFPMLEDYSPEPDWGQVKTRLDQGFAPMFYGSCIERTPDFVDAFRITYAHTPQAQAQMDLAVALQASIIESIPDRETSAEAEQAHVELPPKDFWETCTATLLEVGTDVADWRRNAGTELETRVGKFKAPLSRQAFGNAVMQGAALPFLAVEIDGIWLPMSVRSAPAVVIEHWAHKSQATVAPQAHHELASFVAERFEQTIVGPLTPVVGDSVFKDLTVSCLIAADSGVYLVCACTHESVERVSRAAESLHEKMESGAPLYFRSAGGPALLVSEDGTSGPTTEELRVVTVVTQAGLAIGTIPLPKGPVRLFPLADFITIFDSLSDLHELERYWQFVDEKTGSLAPFSTGPADLFASFNDSHGVLVEGATSPTFIALDPHWGTAWRLKVLEEFWANAPNTFPDDSPGWWVSPETEGTVRLESRHHRALAHSTSVGGCTVQSLVEITNGLQIEDARLLDLFAQIIADSTYRSSDIVSDVPLFKKPHVLFSCKPDASWRIDPQETPDPMDRFESVVTFAEEDSARKGMFHLHINTRAVLAGLNESQDRSFEVRCLLETLEKSHIAWGGELPEGLEKRFRQTKLDPARYHLKFVTRNVDVPDHPRLIIPSSSEYKLARKRLAEEVKALGMLPGQYELSDAKSKIDMASARLRSQIEDRLRSFDKQSLIRVLIEQHDALLATERTRIQRTQQSLSHAVEYDRVEAVDQARKEFGSVARHYRYLLEKTVALAPTGEKKVSDNILRELVGMVNWYMVLTGASDVLHNGIDVGGVVIDDTYIPEVFYSDGSDDREARFGREYARSTLGLGIDDQDAVEGEADALLSSKDIKRAFLADAGFDLGNLLTSLAVLSQAHSHGFDDELALSYAASPSHIAQRLSETVIDLSLKEAENIVAFLTLSDKGICRLAGKDVYEEEVPYWERNKRLHRYSIRPLIVDGDNLRWGAENISRTMNLWFSVVRDGFLPADFDWPHVKPVIRKVKQSIEKRLELRTEDIFRRHTEFVKGGIDFFRRFRGEGFDDVGDYDVFAYWPDDNLLVTVECKYNQPAYTLKDSRRLRDRIFAKAEDDRAGQISRIVQRRKFVKENHPRLLELLGWPKSSSPLKHVELYVSREIYYWMVHPPYPLSTYFVQVDALDTWIKTNLESPK